MFSKLSAGIRYNVHTCFQFSINIWSFTSLLYLYWYYALYSMGKTITIKYLVLYHLTCQVYLKITLFFPWVTFILLLLPYTVVQATEVCVSSRFSKHILALTCNSLWKPVTSILLIHVSLCSIWNGTHWEWFLDIMFISNYNQKQRETPLNGRGEGKNVTKRCSESVKRNHARTQFTF